MARKPEGWLRPKNRYDLPTLLTIGIALKAHTPLFPFTKIYGLTKKGFLKKGRTVTLEPGKIPRRYMQKIEAADPGYRGPLSRAHKIQVYCTCPDFAYRWQYVLYHKGCCPVRPEVDEPPDMTNPTRSIGICRHLTIVLAQIKKLGL